VTIDKEAGLMPAVGFEVVLIDNFLRRVISIVKYQISEPSRVGNSQLLI